ncbi:MAG TPA: glycosyltransferase, partial [Flavisolibacter sp.]|nr:glycosyltransferase [Flavisolibacter sp.]
LLYLDTDMVVNGSIAELYATKMNHYPAAAVAEVNATENRPDLGIDENGTYFNAGVLLMNLPEWRKQQVSEKALQFIYDYPEKIVFVDQDALNVVLKNNYLPLEGKYNVVFHDVPRHLSNRAYRRFASNKVIVHYTNADKPWNPLGRNPLRFLYFDYLKQSPKNTSKRYLGFQPTPRNVLKVLQLKAKESVYNFHTVVLLLERLGLVDKSPVLK